ncbi:kynureninase [Alicyclobacillus ferrooxydans]|uniref:Kynureninase n=1 Tax=Alicyclobacillus ferrooxydans TaxID=471514 RepID=A0A0P9CGW6_9BACL|nr:kynureninase [Alicyclobacillus ferrooxydans]KPV44984.1 kynureninase [Alicyclobacillus ferrooxydans]
MTDQALTRAEAARLDIEDKLSSFRERFYIPDGTLYFDGNSLGLLSKDAEASVQRALDAWKTYAIDGWTKGPEPWFHLPETLGGLSAPLVGALPSEVIVSGSTTVNLHTLLATFYRPTGTRTKILADRENFPSDLYAMHSHIQLHGRPDEDLVLIEPDENGLMSEQTIIDAMQDDIALILLPSVWYKSGQLADIRLLTEAAHARGIVIGFDLAHSIGALPHELHDIGVDFAVWCNYKYVNSGPGATAGLYVHERHHDKAPGLAGWFGSDKDRQFDMAFPLTPARSASKWQLGTPPILATAAIAASLKMLHEADITAIRAKSLQQTSYLRKLLTHFVIDADLGGNIRTPIEDSRRGGHIAFEHEDAVQLAKALRVEGVVPDFRPPYTLRFAPAPLYTSYQDIYDAVMIISDLLKTGRHHAYSKERDVVS